MTDHEFTAKRLKLALRDQGVNASEVLVGPDASRAAVRKYLKVKGQGKKPVTVAIRLEESPDRISEDVESQVRAVVEAHDFRPHKPRPVRDIARELSGALGIPLDPVSGQSVLVWLLAARLRRRPLFAWGYFRLKVEGWAPEAPDDAEGFDDD